MTGILRQLRTPGVLLTALAAVVIAVATLPLFGSTSYAVGLNQQNTVQVSQFVIPAQPTSKVAVKVTAALTAPNPITLADDVAGLFPASGKLLLSKAELITYNTTSPCNGITLDPDQVCMTARAQGGTSAAQHDPPPTGTSANPFVYDGRVKLATQINDAGGLPSTQSPQTTLTALISRTATPPFKITLASTSGFGTTGELTISHQDTDSSSRDPTTNVLIPDQSSEFMRFDNTGVLPAACTPLAGNQLCVTARALNANNVASEHKATGYSSPCTPDTGVITCPSPGVTKVTLHSDLTVDQTDGFFPATPLLIGGTELVGSVKGLAAGKLTSPPGATGTTFRITGRGGATATFDKTAIVSHADNAIVQGADGLTVCRNRSEQPGNFTAPGAQSPADSRVGAFAVCYTRTQPEDPPTIESPKDLLIPLTGQVLITFNRLGQPFLSTGGFTHTIFGAVPHVDHDGTTGDSNDCDGDGDTTELLLCLATPCIENFTPGTNLEVSVRIDTDKSYLTRDAGDITVRLDTIHDGTHSGTGDDCDDPVGKGEIVIDTYIFPGDADASDNNTDGDSCDDNFELDNGLTTGGQRDPWNPHDFYDPSGDGNIVLGEIFTTAGLFGATAPGPPYMAAHDRGPTYGPFGHNTSAPDGSITLGDVFSIAGQFGHAC